MNISKLRNPALPEKQFRHREEFFSDVVKRNYGWLLSLVKPLVLNPSDCEDVLQEALIYCWDHYDLSPLHKDSPFITGPRMSWRGWLAQNIKWSARMQYRQSIQKVNIRYKEMPDYFDFVDDGEDYDTEKEARISALEKTIRSLGTDDRQMVVAYLRNDCSGRRALRELFGSDNNAIRSRMDWAISRLSHLVKIQFNEKDFNKFKNIRLHEAIEFVSDLRITSSCQTNARKSYQQLSERLLTACYKLDFSNQLVRTMKTTQFFAIYTLLKKELSVDAKGKYHVTFTRFVKLIADLKIIPERKYKKLREEFPCFETTTQLSQKAAQHEIGPDIIKYVSDIIHFQAPSLQDIASHFAMPKHKVDYFFRSNYTSFTAFCDMIRSGKQITKADKVSDGLIKRSPLRSKVNEVKERLLNSLSKRFSTDLYADITTDPAFTKYFTETEKLSPQRFFMSHKWSAVKEMLECTRDVTQTMLAFGYSETEKYRFHADYLQSLKSRVTDVIPDKRIKSSNLKVA